MQTLPKWLMTARSKLGTKEVPGKGNNPEIIRWIKDDLGIKWYVKDEIAWCAGFVGWCLSEAGENTTLSLMARSYVSYGQPCKPKIGAILIFKRGTGSQGHVGFYVGENKTHYLVLGGNQTDSVSEQWYLKSRLIASRWPNRTTRSNVVRGGMVGLVGTSGVVATEGISTLSDLASSLTDGAYQLQMLVDYSQWITGLFVALTLGGIVLSLWGRLRMMRNDNIANSES